MGLCFFNGHEKGASQQHFQPDHPVNFLQTAESNHGSLAKKIARWTNINRPKGSAKLINTTRKHGKTNTKDLN